MVNNNDTIEETITNSGCKDVPDWLNENLFKQFLENDFPNLHKITKFIVKPAVKTGENYMTVMLRATIEIELKDSSTKSISYMIKIKPTPQKMQEMITEWKVFMKEHTTYTKYIPAFEEYYRNAGRKIALAPGILEPTKSNITDDLIILEDLRPKGFKNYDRHLGLDVLHTKAVLQKLAQFHAASAHYFKEHGPYPSIYDQCLSTDVDLFEEHRIKIGEILRENLDLYGNFKYLTDKLKIYAETQPDPFQLKSNWISNKFNVLNHGDCWTNNIMFQYDQDGKLMETYLIDFQMSRFGSPAHDLIYFLLSSTNIEVKLKHFDYFIYYYHQQLIDHLKLLQYNGEMPKLRDIHMDLLKHDYWAYTTIIVLMPIILFESREDANMDNLLNGDNDDFKRTIYSSSLYVKHMNIILPWLNNRGTFDV